MFYDSDTDKSEVKALASDVDKGEGSNSGGDGEGSDEDAEDTACMVCGRKTCDTSGGYAGDTMLLCDGVCNGKNCQLGCHFDCLPTPIPWPKPKESWFCPQCAEMISSLMIGDGSGGGSGSGGGGTPIPHPMFIQTDASAVPVKPLIPL